MVEEWKNAIKIKGHISPMHMNMQSCLTISLTVLVLLDQMENGYPESQVENLPIDYNQFFLVEMAGTKSGNICTQSMSFTIAGMRTGVRWLEFEFQKCVFLAGSLVMHIEDLAKHSSQGFLMFGPHACILKAVCVLWGHHSVVIWEERGND